MNIGADTVKAFFTYFMALIIVVGGFVFLYLTRGEGPDDQLLLTGAIIGFMGSAIQFVFNRETQTQTARQVERATSSGTSNGH